MSTYARLNEPPALLNEAHRFIETRRLRFALLGSSARKLKAAGVNLLAGRALKKTMFPLTAPELGAASDPAGPVFDRRQRIDLEAR